MGLEMVVPTREQVQNLKVGDKALDCFGHYETVTSIYAQRDDIHGRAFVCYYTQFGVTSTISGSMKECELIRTVPLTNRYTSYELDQIEQQLKGTK